MVVDDPVDERQGRANRLKQARLAAGYDSAEGAAKMHGWPISTYRAHESGGRHFGLETAEKYAASFGVNPRWIWEGKSEQRVLKKVLPNASPRQHSVMFPTRKLNVVGRAGTSASGELIMSPEIVETVPCPPGLEDVADAYAVYVTGESMEPRYFAGEIVYIHPNRPYRKGDFVLVQVDADDAFPHGYIKQFVTFSPTTLTLRQLNPDIEIEFPRAKVLSIHLAILSGRR